MPSKLRAAARVVVSPRRGLRVPPREDAGSARGATAARAAGATLAGTVSGRLKPTRGDAAIAAVAFTLSLVFLGVGDNTDLGNRNNDVDPLGVALTALASLPLLWRRSAPLAVFVFTGLAGSVLNLISAPAGPPVGPTVALYTVAAAGLPRPRATPAVVVAVFAVHLASAGLSLDAFPGAEILLGVAVWGGAWMAGEVTRLRAERMAELEERALRAEREAERERRLAAAEERMRIARDLHDSAGHAIAVILVHAGDGRLRAERDPAGARAAFATIEEVARETIGEIDQLVSALRETDDPGVEPPPGVGALDGLLARHRAAGLDVTAAVHGTRRPLPPGVDQGAYRIVQEALTNAARHGGGGAALDVAFAEGALVLTVTNPLRDGVATGENGAGRRTARAPAARGAVAAGAQGHGIVGMRERAALLGGRLQAGAHDGAFEVRAWLPAK
jgi:signal transduction histidine kinase